jgi:hypothetical protein
MADTGIEHANTNNARRQMPLIPTRMMNPKVLIHPFYKGVD